VEYGSLLELARSNIGDAGIRTGWARKIERFALRELIVWPRRLAAVITGLRFIQVTGLDRLFQPFLPAALREIASSVPRVPPGQRRRRLPELTPAMGERRGRVAFFEGCVMPELFGAVNAATVRVLARNGFDVIVPRGQGCCGALHAHSGDLDFARGLARVNLEALRKTEVDAVIVNSAGCGASLRDLEHWLPGEGARLADQIRDVTEFLDDVGLRQPEGRIEGRVCYDAPCHLVHGQRVDAAPRRLLEEIPGLTLVPHDDPSGCCGAAGIYNLTHPEMSRAVLGNKMDALAAVDPDFIASGNPGCLMQLRTGSQVAGLRAEVLHPVELLDRAYQVKKPS
jgi:glycolate oxidase iron-sulfur subunit